MSRSHAKGEGMNAISARHQPNKSDSPEIWRDVVDYEGLYMVSSDGRVKSVARIDCAGRKVHERILKSSVAGGYPSISLCKRSKAKTHAVHTLVAEAFLGHRPDGYVIAHWDGDTNNAAASNLRYTTPSENESDKVRHGTQFIARGEKNGHAKLSADQVAEIRHRHCVLKEKQSSLAKEFGVHQSMISHIKRGVHWNHLTGVDHGI